MCISDFSYFDNLHNDAVYRNLFYCETSERAWLICQGGSSTGELLSSHPVIAKMSFTGSVESGSKVMQACAKVRLVAQC